MAKSPEWFFSKVRKEENGCWVWTGTTNEKGYGVYGDFKKTKRAHHFLLPSPLKDGECACHTCDNPACVNPAHLFIGSRADNNRDMRLKGRQYIKDGEGHPNVKLKEWQAKIAKACPRKFGLASALGRVFGVNRAAIRDIQHGRNWSYLPPPTQEEIERSIIYAINNDPKPTIKNYRL